MIRDPNARVLPLHQSPEVVAQTRLERAQSKSQIWAGTNYRFTVPFYFLGDWSGSNRRSQEPQSCALTRLSYSHHIKKSGAFLFGKLRTL